MAKREKIDFFIAAEIPLCKIELVMGRDPNLRELNVNVISRFTICANCEINEWQFSLFFVILSEKLAKFRVISLENAKIRGIEHQQYFTI